MFVRFLSIISLCISAAFGHLAFGVSRNDPRMLAANHKLEGTYSGSMKLVGNTSEIPLTISLVLTGEFAVVPKTGGTISEQQIIDGAMPVDEEGGPYSFSRVTLPILIKVRFTWSTIARSSSLPRHTRRTLL